MTIDRQIPQRYSALCVRFPPTKFNTLSAAPELVEHHPGRARMHRVVPKEAAHRIERAIYVIDTIINPNQIAILGPIFGHTLICTRMNSAHRYDPPQSTTPWHRHRCASWDAMLGHYSAFTLDRQCPRIRADARARRSGRHGAKCEPLRSVLSILRSVWELSKPAACG